jgi:hypothetical protein
MSSNPIYTGRRKIFEEKYTYYVPTFDTTEQTLEATQGPEAGDLVTFQRITQSSFDSLFSPKPFPDYTGSTTEDDNRIDKNYLNNLVFKRQQPISTINTFKFVKKYELVIDSISISTYDYYVGPLTRNTDASKNFPALYPFTVALNNKEVEFSASDQITDFEFSEYGTTQTIPQTYTTTLESLGEKYGGRIYTQKYDKRFELSRFPETLEVVLKANNNFFTEYYKNIVYRFFPEEINGKPLSIDQQWFLSTFMSSLRIDLRIISHIDYDQIDKGLVNIEKPQRIVRDELNLQTLSKLLKDLKEEEKPPRDLLDFLTQDDYNDIIERIKEGIVTKVDSSNYIDTIKQNITI